jgi:hypothetical protein
MRLLPKAGPIIRAMRDMRMRRALAIVEKFSAFSRGRARIRQKRSDGKSVHDRGDAECSIAKVLSGYRTPNVILTFICSRPGRNNFEFDRSLSLAECTSQCRSKIEAAR